MERSNDFAKAMFEVNKAMHNLAVAILAEGGEGASAPEGQTVNHTVIILCQGGPEPFPTGKGVIYPAESVGACTRCQCNTCDYLDTCQVFPASEGIHPPPCFACIGKTGPLMPIEPKYNKPTCERYRHTPEDCRACWCRECLAFEDCVVEVEGYAPESKPCPCDGCKAGQRFMPKEAPPCDNYIPPCAEPVPDEGSAEHDQG